MTTGPPGSRLPSWPDLVSDLLAPLEVVSDVLSGFHGNLASGTLGTLRVAKISSDVPLLLRTGRGFRGTDPDRYELVLQVYGAGALCQDGREAILSPGDFALFHTARPYGAAFASPFEIIVVSSPRKMLRISPEAERTATAVTFSGVAGVGALLSPLISRLAGQLGDYTESTAVRLADNVLDLLGTAIVQRLDRTLDAPADSRHRLLLRVMRSIETRLDDVELGPATIAAENHISTRYLHKLFEAEGTTVTGWIRTRRLERCRRDLADSAQAARPVNAIAARWGLPDPSRFSRLFRQTYGLTPTEYRLLHLQSDPDSARPVDGDVVSET